VNDGSAGDAPAAPVVLVSFNRPQMTRRNLQAIREAAPAELFLLANGPREGVEEDIPKCEAVRVELEAVDWPCRVHRRYLDVNCGADAHFELGLDWVFEHTDRAIVLEDDCVPNTDFFRFCDELLERYRDEDIVRQIASRAAKLPPDVFDGASYAFAGFGPLWGWATWRRAWTAHRRRFPRGRNGSAAPPDATGLDSSRLLTGKGRRYFADIATGEVGSDFAWDSYWALSTVCERGLVVMPRSNLIENIGFGEQATNTTRAVSQRGLEEMQWPLTHPEQIVLNRDLELFIERMAAAYHGRLARFVARRLAQGPVREVVRTLVGAWRDWRVPVK
jgi:hypothetical protein